MGTILHVNGESTQETGTNPAAGVRKTPERIKAPARYRVRQMTAQGLKPREIAMALGVSTQAVYKHLKAIRNHGEAA